MAGSGCVHSHAHARSRVYKELFEARAPQIGNALPHPSMRLVSTMISVASDTARAGVAVAGAIAATAAPGPSAGMGGPCDLEGEWVPCRHSEWANRRIVATSPLVSHADRARAAHTKKTYDAQGRGHGRVGELIVTYSVSTIAPGQYTATAKVPLLLWSATDGNLTLHEDGTLEVRYPSNGIVEYWRRADGRRRTPVRTAVPTGLPVQAEEQAHRSTATLAEKAESLRQQIGCLPGTPLHEIVSKAENELGLTAGGRNLVERIDQCCNELGISGASTPVPPAVPMGLPPRPLKLVLRRMTSFAGEMGGWHWGLAVGEESACYEVSGSMAVIGPKGVIAATYVATKTKPTHLSQYDAYLELPQSTQKEDCEIDEFAHQWVRLHPRYRPLGPNCRKLRANLEPLRFTCARAVRIDAHRVPMPHIRQKPSPRTSSHSSAAKTSISPNQQTASPWRARPDCPSRAHKELDQSITHRPCGSNLRKSHRRQHGLTPATFPWPASLLRGRLSVW